MSFKPSNVQETTDGLVSSGVAHLMVASTNYASRVPGCHFWIEAVPVDDEGTEALHIVVKDRDNHLGWAADVTRGGPPSGRGLSLGLSEDQQQLVEHFAKEWKQQFPDAYK